MGVKKEKVQESGHLPNVIKLMAKEINWNL